MALTTARPANAQPAPSYREQSTERGTAVTFEDDLLAGAGSDPFTAMIRVRGSHAITPLLRPRLHFVPEMLKSVEEL